MIRTLPILRGALLAAGALAHGAAASAQEAAPATWSSTLVTDHQLLRASVSTRDGRVLGPIEDLGVDGNTGTLLFAALDAGPSLGRGTLLLSLPANQLLIAPNGDVFTSVGRARLAASPALSRDAWPDSTDRVAYDNWVASVWRHYDMTPYWDLSEPLLESSLPESRASQAARPQQAEADAAASPSAKPAGIPDSADGAAAGAAGDGSTPGAARANANANTNADTNANATTNANGESEAGPPAAVALEPLDGLRLSVLRLADLFDAQRQRLGRARAVCLDLSGMRVACLVVAPVPELGLGDTLVPIPWRTLQRPTSGDRILASFDRERFLQAPTFPADQWPDLGGAEWQARLEAFFPLPPESAQAQQDVPAAAAPAEPDSGR